MGGTNICSGCYGNSNSQLSKKESEIALYKPIAQKSSVVFKKLQKDMLQQEDDQVFQHKPKTKMRRKLVRNDSLQSSKSQQILERIYKETLNTPKPSEYSHHVLLASDQIQNR